MWWSAASGVYERQLQQGPELSATRFDHGRQQLASCGGLDAWALLVLDAKILHLFAGAAPRWLLSDARRPAIHPLGAFGDELAVRVGAGVTAAKVRVSMDWTHRWTAIGPLQRYGLGVRFRLL